MISNLFKEELEEKAKKEFIKEPNNELVLEESDMVALDLLNIEKRIGNLQNKGKGFGRL